MYNRVRGEYMSVHLAVRSSYSLLNGLMSVKQIVQKAKQEGFGAIALTDFHVLHGSIDFFLEAKKARIKPIIGMEMTFDFSEEQFTSIILAKNNRGFQKLIQYSKILNDQGSISLEECLGEDLVLVLFSENGYFESSILNDDWNAVGEKLNLLQSLNQEMVLGISHQESSFFKESNKKLLYLADSLNIQSIALSKIYYENKEDDTAFKAVQAISKGTYLDDKTLTSAPNRHFLSKAKLMDLYGETLNDNASKLASKCTIDLLGLTTKLPIYENNQDVSNKVYLEHLSNYGLTRRLNGNVTQEYKKRLDYEMSVINSMDFEDYFLIVYDVIRHAKKNDIYVGPGRGSAAGSLVAYVLGITEVDPIQYDLIFERFLNPERISMPDIDIDFPDDKRHLVLEYVKEKYGTEHVAHILTYGSLRARQAFRDVARVLQIPIRLVGTGSKLINSQLTLLQNYNSSQRFASFIDSNDSLKACFDMAIRIEGLPRHASMHAAGIVMSQRPLKEVVPVMNLDDDIQTLQYDMHHLEELGLIKIDFLGLRNLSIIQNISKSIASDFDIKSIPLDDEKTYKLIAKGMTTGIFQLESEGMTNLLMKMKPTRFTDIVDTIALYRPGPMENIPMYLKNRENPNLIEYLHKDLIPLTQSTFGVLIYQEQIMLLAQQFAGFSLAKADILRKAMSKKDINELNTLKQDFIEGAVEKKYDLAMAEKMFELIQKFASYGFNKSHSVAYAMISYQMAYLKANHSYLFYTYLLDSVKGSDSKTRDYIDECRKQEILLMAPSLEKSYENYSLEGHKIRLPFTIIKGISATIAHIIISDREALGTYPSFFDAVSRLNAQNLNSNHLKALIYAGAFDYFGISRESLIDSLENALTYANLIKVKKNGVISLDKSLVGEPDFVKSKNDNKTILEKEYETLGFYFSEHPAMSLRHKHQTQKLSDVATGQTRYRVIAMIDKIKLHKTKNGDPMCFLVLNDGQMSIDAVVFPRVFAEVQNDINLGDMILIQGHMKDLGSIIVEKIHILK